MRRKYRIAARACRRCGAVLDGVAGVGECEGEPPTAGAVIFCGQCGTVSLLDDRLLPRRPTPAELDKLVEAPEVIAGLNAFAKACPPMAYTSAASSGERWRCGCVTSVAGEVFALDFCAPDCLTGRYLRRLVDETADGRPVLVLEQ